MYEYKAAVLNVVDGDTLDMEVDLGFETLTRQRIRLLGINCPEKNTEPGKAARKFVVDWVQAHGPAFTLTTLRDRREKYGRYLGTITATGVGPLDVALVKAGLARPYDGHGPRT